MEEQIVLNKYGRMRLNYLKEHKVWLYEQMLMNGTLSSHLEEIQEQASNQVEDTVDKLKATSELAENMKNSWAGIMNAIKNQAEEIVLNDIYIGNTKSAWLKD